MVWTAVREYVIDNVNIDGVSDELLDAYVRNTGYPDAGPPEECTGTLVRHYCESLNNVGGGATARFVPRMFQEVVSSLEAPARHLAVNGEVTLAVLCKQWMSSNFKITELEDGLARYVAVLENVVDDGPGAAIGSFGRQLRSVHQFLMHLEAEFGGSAQVFVSSFSNECDSIAERARTAAQGIQRILDWKLPGVGLAVAANFLKDVCVPTVIRAGSTLDGNTAAWYAKPDRHVMRVSAIVSGLLEDSDDRVLEFVRSDDTQVRRVHLSGFRRLLTQHALYPAYEVIGETGLQNDSRWAVVLNTQRIAIENEVSALEVDRVCYLIGSGAFPIDGRRTKWGRSMESRYLGLARHLRAA